VPVLDDNGFILTESAAILRYLSCKFNVDQHWYPRSNLEQRARVDEFIAWWYDNLRYGSRCLMMSKFLPTVMPSGDPSDPRLESVYKEGRSTYAKSLKYMETVFLSDNKRFVAGDEVSVADLLAASEIMQCALVESDISQYPRVLAWLQRVRQSVKCFDEVHSTLYFVLKRKKKTPYIEAPTPKSKM
jgi:glutathione S-transferase